MEGFSSKYESKYANDQESTKPLISLLPSFVFVWPSNCGSGIFMLITQTSPSRTSSLEKLPSLSLSICNACARLLHTLVSADLKPETCVPPSVVLILFTNEKSCSP